VIIPTHDRAPLLMRLLGALAAQDFAPGRFEVIVVADGCSDDTTRALAAAELPYALRVVEQAQGGAAAARNRGAAAAAAPTLVFLDDDTVPPPHFLSELQASLAAGADVAAAAVRVADWVPDVLLAAEQRDWDRSGAAAAAAGRPEVVHFAATAVRRACFEAAGGFDEALTARGAWGREDVELLHRVQARGYRLVDRSDVVVDSDCVIDPAVTLRRARDLGHSDVHLATKHPEFAARLFAEEPAKARIQRTVGRLVLAAPTLAVLVWPLQQLVTRAVRRGGTGSLLYRLWLVVWFTQWWRGVVEAGGAPIARSARRR